MKATKTVVTAQPRPATLGKGVVLTAIVTDLVRTGAKPAGQVTFWDDTSMLGTTILHGGKASLSTSLPLGRNTIEVIYAGGPSFSASKAKAVENVKGPRTKTKADTTSALRRSPREMLEMAKTSEGSGYSADTQSTVLLAMVSPALGPITFEERKPALGTVISNASGVARQPTKSDFAPAAGGTPPRNRAINQSARTMTSRFTVFEN